MVPPVHRSAQGLAGDPIHHLDGPLLQPVKNSRAARAGHSRDAAWARRLVRPRTVTVMLFGGPSDNRSVALCEIRRLESGSETAEHGTCETATLGRYSPLSPGGLRR